MMWSKFLPLTFSLVLLSASFFANAQVKPNNTVSSTAFKLPNATLVATAFLKLPFWGQEKHDESFAPFLSSCAKNITDETTSPFRETPYFIALIAICKEAQKIEARDLQAIKSFYEKHFTPFKINLAQGEGFLTGYYEPEIEGSLTKDATFNAPLYKRPNDLISLGKDKNVFDSRGQAARVVGEKQVPYYTRGEIEAGALDTQNLELVYLKNHDEGFFASIQGSAAIRLRDNSVLRIGYDAHNGQPYTPIGRVLVERKIAAKEVVTMDFLRHYLKEDIERAKELRAQNKSYVFFADKTKETLGLGPIGGQGIPITPWRSIAIDKSLIPYGAPLFISGNLPIGELDSGQPFDRLMIAQDTGSAIRGAARGDLYLGSGLIMGQLAGNIKHNADFYILIPQSLVTNSN